MAELKSRHGGLGRVRECHGRADGRFISASAAVPPGRAAAGISGTGIWRGRIGRHGLILLAESENESGGRIRTTIVAMRPFAVFAHFYKKHSFALAHIGNRVRDQSIHT